MASDKPLPERCGATVTTRIGLEVYDEVLDETFSTEDSLESVVLERGDESAIAEPVYNDLFDYTNNGFEITELICLTDDEEHRVDLDPDSISTSHTETRVDGYCERFPMDSGRCYVHGGKAGAPEGNVNSLTHGLRAKRSNYYNNLPDDEKAFVQKLADSWIENAPFDRDNFAKVNEVYRIAVDQHRLWHAHDELDNGLVVEQIVGVSDDGEPVEVEDENPANLAYDRLDRTTIRKLKELGCLDDPESQKAENMESLAEKFEQIDS